MYSNAAAAATPHRRRQRVGRRRFRYRKQAWCLLVSLLVLGFGANLLIIVRILMFTNPEQKNSQTLPAYKPSSSSNNSKNNTNISNETPNYLSLAAKIVGLVLTIVILVRGLNPRNVWKAIVLAPIAFVFESVRATLRWFQGENTFSIARASDSNAMPRPAMTVAETLEAFNRERLARGEATVSSESIEAYERFLRDLATFIVVAEDSTEITRMNTQQRQGLSKEQLETICPRWAIEPPRNNDKDEIVPNQRQLFLSQTECGICLEGYSQCERGPCDEGNTTTIKRRLELRTLPCKHTFHAHCIDQWLGRSVSCPMCKGSVLAGNRFPSGTNTSNESNESIYIL